MRWYIGIDPGKHGAMVILDDAGTVEVVPFDRASYTDRLWRIDEKQTVCCLEHVGFFPGDGGRASFSFGESFGWLQGVLETLKIPYELVRPQKWRKEFSVTGDKNSSVEVAKRLFPSVDLRRSERSRKDDDGIAEALLMAEYAKRRLAAHVR